MEGFALKKGYFSKKWQVLWFTLDNGEITYYTNKAKNSFKGRYKLNPNTQITNYDEFDNQKNVIFLVSQADQGFYFSLETSELQNKWLNAIVEHLSLMNLQTIDSSVSLRMEGYEVIPTVKANKNDLTLNSLEGYATKRGHFIPNWKVRWFHLDKGFINYYEDQTKLKLKGSFPLYEDTMVIRHIDMGNYKNILHVYSSKDKGLYFSLDSFETKEIWINGLLKHIEHINTDYLYDIKTKFEY